MSEQKQIRTVSWRKPCLCNNLGYWRPWVGDTGSLWAEHKGQVVPFDPARAPGICPVLLREQWKVLDQAVRNGMKKQSPFISLLQETCPLHVPDALGKMIHEYEQPVDPPSDDAPTYQLRGVPLPITHSDFSVTCSSSGKYIDDIPARVSGRRVVERVEGVIINGEEHTGFKAYGLLNSPRTMIHHCISEVNTSVEEMVQILKRDGFNGPYATLCSKKDSDLPNPEGSAQWVCLSDSVPSGHLVVLQLTPDVISLIIGLEALPVQWPEGEGYKTIGIYVPLLQKEGAGVVHGIP